MKFFNSKYVALLATCLSFAFSSCKHNDSAQEVAPVNHATITITSPKENDTLTYQQTLNITGTIVGEQTVHGYTIYVRKKAGNVELLNQEVHEHSTNLTINSTWKGDTVTAPTDMEIEVVAALSHEGNTVSKKVNFVVKP